jgi:hypothetical protein
MSVFIGNGFKKFERSTGISFPPIQLPKDAIPPE